MAAGCWSVIKRFCSGLSSHFTDSESESGECELKSHNRLRSICNTKLLQRTIRSKSPDRDSSRVQQELLGTGDWYSRPIDTQLEDALTHPPPDVKKTIMSNSLVKILCRATSEKHSDGQHTAQPREREEPISLTLLCTISAHHTVELADVFRTSYHSECVLYVIFSFGHFKMIFVPITLLLFFCFFVCFLSQAWIP